MFQQMSSTLEYIAQTNCFIHLVNREDINTALSVFIFKNNHILGAASYSDEKAHGKSIFIHSLKSCQKVTEFFELHFIFENSLNKDEISTEGKTLL